jgi:hypothetical protein
MEEITTYKGRWWILAPIAAGIGLIVILGFIVSPVQGSVFVYGSVPNYSAVVLPNNSYVHQGENISQGNNYDLRGVYGFSGELAHWNNDNLVGQGQPDQIVTLTGKGSTYIDSAIFPVGRWWQWDGNNYCNTGSDYCTSGFGHGNAYVFAVVPQLEQVMQTVKVTKNANITITSGEGTVIVPVTYSEVETRLVNAAIVSNGSQLAVTETATQPIPTNPEVQDKNGIPIPGGVSGATVVTVKGAVPVAVPTIAIIGMIVYIGRRKVG